MKIINNILGIYEGKCMNYKLIDGKTFAEKLVMKVASAVNVLNTKHHIKPGLAVVLVG